MATFFSGLLGVMLLLDPHEEIDTEAAAAVSADADRVTLASGAVRRQEQSSARIRSDSSAFDRNVGVILFEGNVVIEYETDYMLCADRVFAFLTASNRLSRVVADGNIVISNEMRVGTCALATFRKARNEIEMFGKVGEAKARLSESGAQSSAIEGDRIRFWLDTEQVEVTNSRISTEIERSRPQ